MAIGVIGGLASGVFGAISGGAARRRARRRQRALVSNHLDMMHTLDYLLML